LRLIAEVTQNGTMKLPIAPPALSAAEALTDLWRRGTPENTLRAWERDLAYIAAWKLLACGEELAWPESESVALRFLLEHAQDLSTASGPAREVAEALIAAGLRRSLACPAPATLDRRIASWRAFHRMKNLTSPFQTPLITETRGRARRAAARPRQRKSANPITRAVLEQLLASCDASHRGLRDRACLMLGWASGGRRRAEIVALNRADINSEEFAENGLLRIRLLSTKTTGPALDRGRRHRRRAAVPAGEPGRPGAEAPALRRWSAPDLASSPGAGRLPGRIRQHAWLARRLPDPGRARPYPPARRHAAQPASLGSAGPGLLCRCRYHREPGDGSAGVTRRPSATPTG